MLNSKVILKYALLHLPELAVVVVALIVSRNLIGVPTWVVVVITSLWILKDIAIYPIVWRAYAFYDNSPMKQLIGLETTVIDDLNPVGYVRVGGELWKADIGNETTAAKMGDTVTVVDTRGITLIVKRMSSVDTPREDR